MSSLMTTAAHWKLCCETLSLSLGEFLEAEKACDNIHAGKGKFLARQHNSIEFEEEDEYVTDHFGLQLTRDMFYCLGEWNHK